MKSILKKNRSLLTAAAAGRLPCTLSVENAQLVNVFTGEIYPASVDIYKDVIVRVREAGSSAPAASERVLDARGLYLLPGFIDTHMHVESSLLVPENFGKAAVVWGTTSVFTDPHEIANVLGAEGVRYMLESAKRSPVRQFTLIPSCVPSLPGLETAGAVLDAEDVDMLLREENVCGVAELMDYLGVIEDDRRMHDIIAAGEKHGAFLQGHAPGVRGSALCAYIAGGPVSDHEITRADELLEKRRLGMHIDARIHSPREAEELYAGIRQGIFRDTVSLCTDDVNAFRLQKKGHINRSAADLIEAGMPPVEVIRLATLNAAYEYGLRDLGAVAPGYAADIQLVQSLSFDRKPEAVFVGGVQVSDKGLYTGVAASKAFYDKGNTVKLAEISGGDDFRIPAQGKAELGVMVVNEGYENKKPVRKRLKADGGFAALRDSEKGSFNYVCVLSRYGRQNKTIALYSGFGLKKGAVASTISHDSHNLFVLYADPEDAYTAAEALRKAGGGVCLVTDGRVRALLSLPVAGLMSDLPLDETAAECAAVEAAVAQACGRAEFSLSDLIFETLPVVPRYTPTDIGVVDGETKQLQKIIE